METEIFSYSSDPKNSIFKAERSDRAKNFVILCKNPEACPLYAKKQCLMLNSFGTCPNGKKTTAVGPTTRAAGYSKFLSDFSNAHKDTFRNGLHSCKKFAHVPGGVFFPISFVALYDKVRWISGGGFMNFDLKIMDEMDYTPENMAAIVTFVPRPMFGSGNITDYQEKEVPLLMRQLREEDPDMYAKVMELLPDDVRKHFETFSNVGRKAMLFSTVPGVGEFIDCHKAHWYWDGEYLTSTDSKASFMLCKDFSEIRVKPSKDVEVTITDDAQTDGDTIFTD